MGGGIGVTIFVTGGTFKSRRRHLVGLSRLCLTSYSHGEKKTFVVFEQAVTGSVCFGASSSPENSSRITPVGALLGRNILSTILSVSTASLRPLRTGFAIRDWLKTLFFTLWTLSGRLFGSDVVAALIIGIAFSG